MSDTTSTNISVAQANSTESTQAGSSRPSHLTDLGSTKRICFYKSGDPRFNGIKMVVTNRSFKTFDALLDSLSKKVPLPFGVRNITTPRGMHHITSLEDLEDGKSYICSHQKKIKPINLERASKKPLLWQSSRPISARRRRRQNEVVPFQRENTIVMGSSKNLVIFKNGDTGFKHNVILNKKTTQNFDAFLEQITEDMQCPVFKLYSTDGRRILSIHALLLSSGTIVAAGREPFKPANYDSEREFLPTKLPGISNRVFPKSRSKSEMRSQLKTDEPTHTNLDGHEHSLSSAKICNKDNNLVDYSYIPENEKSLTERWPHSGEELPVISPGDDIEKSVHLNSDGSMTVEMKIRFKIKEEETINWSTTVSRSELSYYKRRLLSTTSDPEIQAVAESDFSLKSNNKRNNTTGAPKYSRENQNEPCTEDHLTETKNSVVNINSYSSYSTKKEKTHFYRPPTPGIRKLQEQKLSVKSNRRVSNGNLGENMSQIFCKETEHGKMHSINDTVTQYNQQIMTLSNGSDCDFNRAEIEGLLMGSNDSKVMSAIVKEENFELSETRSMEILQRDMVGKTVIRKSDFTSERKDYVSFTGTTQRDRPHSAGKRTFQEDQFKFKEIKRSVSASLTFSEPSNFHTDVSLAGEDSTNVMSKGKTHRQMVVPPCHETLHEAQVTTAMHPSASSEKDICINSDTQSSISAEQKEKKKKKNVGDQIKQKQNHHSKKLLKEGNVETEIVECNLPAKMQTSVGNNIGDNIKAESPMLFEITSHGGDIQGTKNVTDEDLITRVSTCSPQSEVRTFRKFKGNKQMAKVKPRWVKKNDDSVNFNDNNQNENIDREINTEHNLTNGKEEPGCEDNKCATGSVIYNNQAMQYPLPQHNQKQVGGVPKKSGKTSKNPHKSGKKQNPTKKKIKNSRNSDNVIASGSDSFDKVKVADSYLTANTLESYVQSWLKNIFPNAAFPVIQLLSSTRTEDNLTHSKNSQDTQLFDETKKMNEDKLHGDINNKPTHSEGEISYAQPIPTEASIEKATFTQQTGSSLDEETFSILMEKSKHLTDLFTQQNADFEHNVFSVGSKTDELITWMANNQIINVCHKKPSTDVAVQVEAETNNGDTLEVPKNVSKEDNFIQQPQSTPVNIPNDKSRYLEKSLSLPSNSSKATNSSSQLLLAWLIVLNIEQGMQHLQEDMSQGSRSGSIIFTLLQSLKKVAIIERADDLKAAIINLQESALRHNVEAQNPTNLCENLPTQEFTNVPSVIKMSKKGEDNSENKVDFGEIKALGNMEEILKKEDLSVNNKLTENIDDLEFFPTLSNRESSSEHTENQLSPDTLDNVNQCNGGILELEEFPDKTASHLLNYVGQSHCGEGSDGRLSSELARNASKAASPKSNAGFDNDQSEESKAPSMKKISKVKMMVQEMEQRKHYSQSSEHCKCLQSPISSDWSDYRQDSDESGVSDTLRASSEIMTESGEEQMQEKPHKAGFVKRAIERLYGNAETKIKPSNSPNNLPPAKVFSIESHVDKTNKNATFRKTHQCLANQNMLRSLSSPNDSHRIRNQENYKSCLKSSSLLEEVTDHVIISQQQELLAKNELELPFLKKDEHHNADKETDTGVLIDKGRWLLKENHLVRRSPPEITGMYGHLDTTSADTFLDNTSDEIPYPHSLCRLNQQLPLADVSSSELEDMVKPQKYGCHYFNMPHGSDSEPFSDTSHFKSSVRPKTSAGLFRSKTGDNVSQDSNTTPLQRGTEVTGSLPSFTTVDFNYSDNKVHPLLQSKNEKPNEDLPLHPSNTNRRQLREQDSLDKLHFICGQHCPILTASVTPINEENRGFVYCKPSDIENLMLHPIAKKGIHKLLINKGLITDENNNVHIQNKYTTAVTNDCYHNTFLMFTYKGFFWKIRKNKYGMKDEQYNFLNLQIVNKNLNRLDCPHNPNNIFTQVTYSVKDENNNIVYH